MGRRAKLLEAVRNNPSDVRFDDACKIAEWLGFMHKGGKGRHRAYHNGGKIPRYQADQLIAMIDKHEANP